MGQFGVGQSLKRVEDQRFLTGTGEYTDDIRLENTAHAQFFRSPVAHGVIASLDVSAAKSAPGVLAVYTVEDIDAAGLGDIPCNFPLKQKDGSPLVKPSRPILARGRVRHVGEPIAMVVAESDAQARDAVELIEADFDELPVTIATGAAQSDGAQVLHEEARNNVCFEWEMGDEKATDAAFAQAAHTVTLNLINNRLIPNSMEPRNAIGDWVDGRYVLYTSSQGPHGLKGQLGDAIFKTDPENFRVVTRDVGGGFGMKIFLYNEQPMVCFAAKNLQRPVVWNADRSADGFLSDDHGRDHVSTAELALDADYKFIGLRVKTIANLGAYLSNFAPFIPTHAGSDMLVGVYTTPALHVDVTGVFTNTAPVDAYRGAGRPEAAFLVERLVDKAARELGVDAAELRRKNYIPSDQMPYTTGLGAIYDSGKFERNMDAAIERADRAGFPARRAESEADGKLRGMGLAYYVEACGAGGGETADLTVSETGKVTLKIGSQNNGQGQETAFKQIIADRIGIHMDDIEVLMGDSDVVLTGGGTGGSRAVAEGGSATKIASQSLVDKGKEIAAHVMEAASGDIDFEDGVFSVAGTDKSMSLSDVAKAAMDASSLPDGMQPGFGANEFFKGPAKTYPNGCHICELEIDKATGTVEILRYTVVDDFGKVVNPMMLAGQVHGGIGQGVGQALMERTVYDDDSGQLLSGSFMDYTLPRADNLPFVDFTYYEDAPCTSNPMGVKGAGEAGAIGAPPAVINALVDALAPYGVEHIDMPATPEVIWTAIHGAGRAE
ncbi:MAG: xanthine dehydrogenase family protein molybdopterin-binding subunit [Alphaproteobacteria bacterium]|nr:xanthine dehydrogenase family protein molybdopterin-binding subunit [Alphaproteobacteria bacterium]